MKASRIFGGSFLVAAAISGCQIIGGIDDIELAPKGACDGGVCATGGSGAAGTGGGPDASAGTGGTGAAGGGPGDAGGLGGGDGAVIVEPCDPEERPVDDRGIFAAPTGSDTASGNRQSPFRTVNKAISTALAAGRSQIYLAPGPYDEVVVLENLGSGLTIRGGWLLDGTRWVRDCTPLSRQETVINQPSDASIDPLMVSPTMTVRNAIGTTVLQSLTISTKISPLLTPEPGADGETMTAIYVDPSTTGKLHLVDVSVQANNGGPGGEGVPAAATPTAACDGTSGCADGAEGVAGVDGETPEGGRFTPTGFAAGRGGQATRGTYGVDGFPGGAGDTSNTNACSTDINGNPVCGAASIACVPIPGTCGCGGPSSDAGKPGGGGGASVGILVASPSATVAIVESRIEAKAGGNGGAGSPSGTSELGTDGVDGPARSCSHCCSTTTRAGGPAGGPGGSAGGSGNGGGGAGGPSHAIVTVGPTNVTVTDSELVFLTGGQSPSGAVAAASERLDQLGCGNGSIEAGEECDDANSLDDDACSNACVLNCGADGEFVHPLTGACYRALAPRRTPDGARALCQNLGPGWDIMVPSTDEVLTYLTTRSPLPSAQLYVGLQSKLDEITGGMVWAAVDERPVAPSLGAPAALTSICATIGPTGVVSEQICTQSLGVLCERRVDQFQTACGNGTLERFEECDDNNIDADDGCSPECMWDCTVAGVTGYISVPERSCYLRLDAPTSTIFSEAQSACSDLGGGWRMVKLETKEELASVNATPGVGSATYWLGASNERVLGDGGVGLGPWRWQDRTSLNTSSVWTELASAPAGSCMTRSGVNASYSDCSTPLLATPVCEFKLP